jgi:alpha/beta superfamily hydrolase
LPTSLIVGSKDHRIDQHWNKEISKYNINVINIHGANHFFDNEFEFELISQVEGIIEKIKK